MNEELIFPIIGAESKLPVYVVGVGWHRNQHAIERRFGFPYFQVIYCTKGSGVLPFGNTEYQITNQQVLFLYPEEPHEYYAKEEPWETHWLTFNGDAVQSLVQALGFVKSKVFNLHNYTGLDNIWRQMLLEAKSNHNDKGFRCSALSYNFLILLKSLVSEEASVLTNEKRELLNKVLLYIDKNYNRDLGMTELTSCVGVSAQYLCRLFKKYLYMRPFEYVTKKRIQEAKTLLIEKKLPEADIARLCGFNSFSYFCAMFKRLENMTPNEFRKLHWSE